MRVLSDPAAPDRRSETLLVMLPGAETRLEDFELHGFIAAVRKRHLAVDIQLAALTYEHVMARTAIGVLHEQVIRPARAAGYRAIWLAGISLGALNALMYASAHAAELAGLCLLAPYPGTGDILEEIRAAGGPLAWAATPAASQGDEREMWRWLVAERQRNSWPVPVYLATGDRDRFLRGQRMMADLLPAERVRILPGGHDWPAWQAQWSDWLDREPLAPYLEVSA